MTNNEYCGHPSGDCLYANEFKALREVADAARLASKVINNHYLKEPPHDNDLWFARDQIDIALKKLDEARSGGGDE